MLLCVCMSGRSACAPWTSLTYAGLQVVKLKAFSKFDSTVDALSSATALVDSKLSKGAHLRPTQAQFLHACAVLYQFLMDLAIDIAAWEDIPRSLPCYLCRPEEISEEECNGKHAWGGGLKIGQHHQGKAGHPMHLQVIT